MEAYKTINWQEKDADDVYEFFDTIPEEKHYDFLKWLAHHYPELDIDWLDIFEDMRFRMPFSKNIAACEEFSVWYAAKFPVEYAGSFEFIERDLCDYYLHTKNIAKLREHIAFISINPVPAVDTLIVRLLFQLLYNGYYDDAVNYALAVWKPVYDSEALIRNPAIPFMNTLYLNRLQKCYSEILEKGTTDFDDVYSLTIELGFDDDTAHFELIKSALQKPVNISRIKDSIQSGSDDHMYELNIHFIKYMWSTWKIPFIVSDALWSIVATRKIFGKINDVDKWFYVDVNTMSEHIDNWHQDILFSSNSLEIFGKVWGMHYIFDFFHKLHLLDDEYAGYMAENLAYHRNEMVKYLGEELWQVSFVFQWPDNHLWSDLKPLFDSTYQKPTEEARTIVDNFCSGYMPGVRIENELQRDKSTRDFDNFYEPFTPYIKTHPDIGRNDPCPCGSGKKYKKCCMDKN